MDVPGLPPVFSPMLAASVPDPFDSPEHWFEVKWDGVRVLAFCEPGRTRLYSRTGRDVTAQYPELASLHERVRAANAVLDGEVVAIDGARPSFERLQSRINLARPGDILRASAAIPVDLVLFDLVFAEGRWLAERPLAERFDRLREAVEFGGPVALSQPVPGSGIALFEAARSQGLEGVVAKRASSIYVPGKRTRDWLKVKVVHEIDCVIGGWNPGEGSRRGGFGSLLLGVHDQRGRLTFIGSVGTGFDERTIAALWARLGALEIPDCPFAGLPPLPHAHWVRPELVCRVEYREMTRAPRLRAPSFKGLRDDKPPEECRLPPS